MELTNFSCAREKLPLACTREKIEMREGRDGEWQRSEREEKQERERERGHLHKRETC